MSNKGFTEPEHMDQPIIDNGNFMEGSTLYTGEQPNQSANQPPQQPNQQHIPGPPPQPSQPPQAYWNGYAYIDQNTGQPIPNQPQMNPASQNPQIQQSQVPPAVDRSPKHCIIEFPDKFMILLDIPGISKDSIEIDFTEPVMTITGHRFDPREQIKEEHGENVAVHDSNAIYGDFNKRITIKKAIDEIDATLEDGVLTIQATFRAIKPAKISIK